MPELAEPCDTPSWTWLVDGFNLLHAVILQGRERASWWQRAAQERVIGRLNGFRGAASALWVVFDVSPSSVERCRLTPESERLRVVFAPCADDWILDFVDQAPDANLVHIVTADRSLGDRCRWRGAQVLGPRAFAAQYLSDAPTLAS